MGYLNQSGNSIGSLLRFIQEQKSQSPIVPPSTESGSPIRGVVQEPLNAPESVGTSRQISIRPEGAISSSQGESIQQGVGPVGESRIAGLQIGGPKEGIAPVAINEPGPGMSVPSASKSVGDVMNKSPQISQGNTVMSKSGENITPVKQSVSPVSLGTTITPQGKQTPQVNMQSPAQQVYDITQRADKWLADISKPGAVEAYLGPEVIKPSQPKQPVNVTTGSFDSSKYGKTTYTAPKKESPVTQAAQKIATTISQSPWSWLSKKLFGR